MIDGKLKLIEYNWNNTVMFFVIEETKEPRECCEFSLF